VKNADMLELVRTLQRFTPVANLDRMITDHTVDASGHCPTCRSLGCTLYTAAMSARYVSRSIR
jgi:hypothetical protein